jgi:hypothetical protein
MKEKSASRRSGHRSTFVSVINRTMLEGGVPEVKK